MAVKTEVDVEIRGKDELSPELDRIESRVIRFVGAVSSALTAFRVAAFPVQAIRQFEAELANVQKTTGFTDREIKGLSESLVNMSRQINVSANDLAKIAAAAGQQGLGTEGVDGIERFTESVARMAAVLDLTVDQAGTDIGKIASIFKVPLRDIERAVSAFNETSNNSTASGEQLLDVVKRIGDAAGSLDLAQSIGLSATGIDLGLSPEVVGTSFSKVFAEMYARAEQFSQLLGVSVEDWMTQLQTNGIDSLKMYLDALRGLTPEAQQQTIKALSGGGRIGVLVTKLVRDVEDSVLDKNVRFAEKGFDEATSAIKEQQTVLQTLDAEIFKTGNSFTALGIKAGEKFAGPLAGYLAQLNEGLAGERVIAFAEAVGGAFLDLFNIIASGIKLVASLNVNWENFITFAKLFATLKVVQILSGMAMNVTGLGTAWENLAKSATAAADAQTKASGASKVAGAFGVQEESQRIGELLQKRREYLASIEAQKLAVQEVEAAQKALAAAEEQRFATGNKLRAAQEGLTDTAGRPVTAARADVVAVEQASNARIEATRVAHQRRLEQAEQSHAQRIHAIEMQRIQAQNVAREQGDRRAVLAATRDRNAQLAEETAYQERSLRSINAYYARRLSTVTAAATAEVAASRAAFAASLSEFDGAVARSGTGNLSKQFEAASEAVVIADDNLKRAQATVAATGAGVSRTAAAFNALGVGVRVAATAMAGLMRIAGRLFFWFTVIYTVLEALGITQEVGKYFDRLTDFLGFTSEASRKLAQDQKELAARQREVAEATDAATEALQKYKDATTNRLSDDTLSDLTKGLASQDVDAYKAAVDEIIKINDGLSLQLKAQDDLEATIPLSEEKIKSEVAEVEAAIAEAQDTLQNRIDRFQINADRGDMGSILAIKEAQDAYDALTNKLKELQAEQVRYSASQGDIVRKNREDVQKDLADLQKLLSGVFTDQSADVFLDIVPKQIAALEELEAAERARKAASEETSKANGTEQEAEMALIEKQAIDRERIARENIASIGKQLGEAIAQIKAQGGLSEAVVGSLDFLTTFLNTSKTGLQGLLVQVQAVKSSAAGFTGATPSPVATPAQGTGTNEQTTDAEARRLRRARLDVVKAGLEAEADLKKEANDQQAEADEYAYDRGTLAIEDYYRRRREILQDNAAIELNLKQQELAALEEELGKATQESEKLRTQASIIKAQGDIDVLIKQREAITDESSREQADALRDFADQVLQERQAIADYFGAASDQSAFQLALDNSEAAYRDWITRLRTEAENMPELNPVIDAIEAQAKFEAVEAGLQSIARETQLTTGALELVERRLSALRDAGILSRGGYAALEEENRKAIIGVMRADIERHRAMMENLVTEQGEAAKLTQKYRELSLEIAGKETDLLELELQANEVAQRINDDLKSSIESGLLDAFDGEGTVGEAFRDFLLSVVDSVRQVAAEGLADIITQQLGSIGDGGFGGLISRITGSTADTADALRPSDLAGSSPATPMYVVDANEALDPSKLLGEGGDAVTDAAKTGADATATVAKTGFEELGTKLSGLGSSLVGGFQTVGSSIVSGVSGGLELLVSVFTTVGNAIVTAIFSSAAGDSTASLVSAGAAVAGAAHTGGIAGRLTMKKSNVNPAVFANATRLHSGGVAGLSANEVPVILEEGEEVLTKQDPRHRDNGGMTGKGEGDSGSMATPVFNVQPVLSEAAVLDAMKGSQGQKLLIVHIARNPTAFRQALKLD